MLLSLLFGRFNLKFPESLSENLSSVTRNRPASSKKPSVLNFFRAVFKVSIVKLVHGHRDLQSQKHLIISENWDDIDFGVESICQTCIEMQSFRMASFKCRVQMVITAPTAKLQAIGRSTDQQEPRLSRD